MSQHNTELQSPESRQTQPSPVDPLLGTTIDGRYQVERLLGEGGMGLVYQARHVVLNKLLAVKVLRAEVSNNEQVIARFRQEAQSATAIGNQHIIDVLDFGSLPDASTYFVMEFLNGSALTDVIAKEAPLTIARVVHIATQLCDALGAAHGAGIVHRDLKPDNVFLVKRGQDPDFVKVLDFGIAKVGGTSSKLTQAGQVFGTPHYMAPEQCQGKSVDLRADIYALGVMIFELVTGKLPFDAENLMALLTAHMMIAPPAPSSMRADCPPELESIILRCLEKDPDARYEDCAAMLADLRAFGAGLPVSTPRVSGIVESRTSLASRSLPPPSGIETANTLPPPAPTPAGFKAAAAGLALFGVLGLGFAGYRLTRPKPVQAAPIAIPQIAVAPIPPAGVAPPDAMSTHIRLVSDPIGAEVASNGELLGITPFEITRPGAGERRELTFQLAGYESRMVTISSSTLGAELRFTLRREGALGARAGTRTTPRATQATAPDTAMAEPTAPPPADPTQGDPPRRRHTSEVINPWGN